MTHRIVLTTANGYTLVHALGEVRRAAQQFIAGDHYTGTDSNAGVTYAVLQDGHVRGAVELLAQRRVEPPPQFLATCQTPTDADIVGKEAHHCVEVAQRCPYRRWTSRAIRQLPTEVGRLGPVLPAEELTAR